MNITKLSNEVRFGLVFFGELCMKGSYKRTLLRTNLDVDQHP